jgi:hypothetical protein
MMFERLALVDREPSVFERHFASDLARVQDRDYKNIEGFAVFIFIIDP